MAKRKTSARGIDAERKRLLAAILDFSTLVRRPEPRSDRGPSRLGLGRAMQEHGLEARHMSALLTVALYGPMSVTKLAERQHATLKTASLLAVELEQAGLVERSEDPKDRRRTIVAIAKSKTELVNEGLNRRAADLQSTLDRLTPSQREGLITGLDVLSQEMSRRRNRAVEAEK